MLVRSHVIRLNEENSMSERVEAMTVAMEEFVRQDDYQAMVLAAGDDDLLYPLKALDGLDRDE